MSAIEMKIALAYWRDWNLDTHEIARRLGLEEFVVYNALSRAREKQMRRAA